MASTKEIAQELFDKTKQLESGKAETTAEQLQAEIEQLRIQLQASPDGKEAMEQILQDKKADRFAKRYTPYFNALLAGADVVTSLSQVRNAKNAARELIKPTLPNVPGIDPLINNQIAGAQAGTYDASRAIAPAKQGILDQYLRDVNIAGQVGGGQSAAYGALAQTASLRRDGALKGLIPLADSVRAREQGRLDNLLGLRSNLVQQNYQNQLRQTGMNLDQYNLDAAAIGQLGSQGRFNLRQSFGNLMGQAPQLLGRLYNPTFDKYDDYVNKSLNNPNRAAAYQYQYNPQDNFFDYNG